MLNGLARFSIKGKKCYVLAASAFLHSKSVLFFFIKGIDVFNIFKYIYIYIFENK